VPYHHSKDPFANVKIYRHNQFKNISIYHCLIILSEILTFVGFSLPLLTVGKSSCLHCRGCPIIGPSLFLLKEG
jgi:hypothetical protein